MTVLKTEGLSKSYGKIRALQNVSFEVPPGSVFGILGPNGSGKTTLLGTVLEILYPSAGRFQWFDAVFGRSQDPPRVPWRSRNRI